MLDSKQVVKEVVFERIEDIETLFFTWGTFEGYNTTIGWNIITISPATEWMHTMSLAYILAHNLECSAANIQDVYEQLERLFTHFALICFDPATQLYSIQFLTHAKEVVEGIGGGSKSIELGTLDLKLKNRAQFVSAQGWYIEPAVVLEWYNSKVWKVSPVGFDLSPWLNIPEHIEQVRNILEQSLIKGQSIQKALPKLILNESLVLSPKDFVYIKTPRFSTIFRAYQDAEIDYLGKIGESLKPFVKKL